MRIDKRYYKLIEKAFTGIAVPITVYDPSGEQIYPVSLNSSVNAEIPSLNWENNSAVSAAMQYVKVPLLMGHVLGCPGSCANGESLLQMASLLLTSLVKSLDRDVDKDEVLRKILLDGLYGTELETLAMEHGLEMQKNRCAILFQCDGEVSDTVSGTLKEAFSSTGGSDLVTAISRNSVVLLRCMDDCREDELTELVQALMDTVVEETGLSMKVGIGETKPELNQMAKSLSEARKAIEIGRVFRREDSIFSFRSLLMERFMCEVPEELARKYYEVLFNKKNSRIFNEEMIVTIDRFFDCHLNVSEAARQLYIHRNTLVYRLDKVQRATGLDLRSFEDAITFKLLWMLGRTKDGQK